MFLKRSVIALSAALIAFGAAAAPAVPPAYAPVAAQVLPDGQKALAHVRHLASDELQGRRSGTDEYRRAAEYVAAKMKEAGLRPGGDNGGWFQEVKLPNWSHFPRPARLEIVSPARRAYFAGRGRDFTPVNGTGSGVVKGPLVFAGYGFSSEKDGWDDYAGLDLEGKVALVMADLPPFVSEDAKKEWNLEKKVRTAAGKGAVGLVEMNVAEPDPAAGRRPRPVALRPGQCPEGFVVLRAGRNFADDAFYAADKSWRDLVSRTLRARKSHTVDVGVSVEMEAHFVREDRTAPNVIGILPGRDPKLKNEALVVGGHLDHIGAGVDGWVYNGADDNAASVAVILELARALTAGKFRPARSVIFAAWAAEELGLHGSRHYVEHPVFPLDKTVLYMNMDMVGTGDPNLLVGGMGEFAELFAVIERGLSPDLRAKLRSRPNYRGSDHTSFWDKLVPAISLRTGDVLTRRLDDHHPEYHYPGDRAETIDPDLLALAGRYHYEILTHLAMSKDDLLDPVHRTLFLHRDAFVADLHCDTIGRYIAGEDLRLDLPKGHVDIPKLKRGGVDLQVFACFAAPPRSELEKSRSAKSVFAQLDALHRLVEDNPDDLALVRSVEELNAARAASKVGVLPAIEGGYAIENDPAILRSFYRAGFRLMTLTHWYATDWADASGDPEPVHGGLTGFGEQVIEEMNRLGMIVDVSHVHDETFWDVLRVSKAPVVASHSACRDLSPHHRSLSDEMLKALAEKGGLVGINFWPGLLRSEIDRKQEETFAAAAAELGVPADRMAAGRLEPAARDKLMAAYRARWAEVRKTLPVVDVKTVVDHIDHIVKLTGKADHVGLGSDYDGISDTPVGLENIGLLPNVTKELVRRGYKPEDIRKILGGNFLRVFAAVERAAHGT